jgi:hypothetical protein
MHRLGVKKKFFVYFIMLAGWLVFCYWLYSRDIYPHFHASVPRWAEYREDLTFPLAFTWQSDVPIEGPGFNSLAEQLLHADTTDHIILLYGFYFRDEEPDEQEGKRLARRRVDTLIKHLQLDKERLVVSVTSKEIYSDVRSQPFAGIDIVIIPLHEIYKASADTLEICFPLQDSVSIPGFLKGKVHDWAKSQLNRERTVHITGIADGTGIAESSDMAMERGLYMKEILSEASIHSDSVNLSTGQRNLSNAIQNRCVIIYNE